MGVKFILTVLSFVFFMVFVVQNMEVVEINFLIWTVTTARAILFFSTFLLGLVMGWFFCSYSKNDKQTDL